ncbi:DNA excision repair protein ERCC-6 [Nematocida minor]|uniref:DNA excision repair protein ERCC-6 n=1 Tax=Nematocida minor TaxID=1912983 RepID=UPI00222076A7|nr:DNA excision repair protein ERCC-6 [Nematocida minor]KAI5189198.1 DNA excision repair protein ERCC-6 [Nematocida minor]
MVSLKEHQLAGVDWMWEKVKNRRGVILGDEMGTGKTAQVLKVVERVWETVGKSVLIVAPCTLLQNWKREMKNFDINIPVKIVRNGDASIQKTLRSADGNYILIAGYELVQKREADIMRMYFDILVLDEAQRVKNRNTKISKLCRAVDARAKICITGTPIQNNLSELWSIVEMVKPGHFGDYQKFKTEIEGPLKQSTLKTALPEDRKKGEGIKQHINKLISEIVLRRTKEQLGMQIPEKTEHIIYCPLSEAQQEKYASALEMDIMRSTVMGKTNPLKTITYLKGICSHPSAVCSIDISGEVPKDKKKRRSGKSKLWTESGKMKTLHRLLFQWRNSKRKVIVFSQYKEVLRILEDMCSENIFYKIDGDTPVHRRQEIFQIFGNSGGLEILLMTTKVGGVGVNLQQSNTVILFDMDWNPFNEEQAKGRAHRIGQMHEVEVYKFVCKGTIEETIGMVQEVKKSISEGILDGAKTKKAFEKVDLCKLFHYSHDPDDITELGNYK